MKKPMRLPILREDRTIEIPLTAGHVAIVDWEDVWACAFNWHVITTPTGHLYAGSYGTLLHREIMGLGKRNGSDVDHINGDTLNCRRENLRVVSHQTNTRNRKIHHNNKSGVPGVRYNDKTNNWSVTLCGVYLGTYAKFEDARAVRLDAEKKSWGIEPRREELHAVSDTVLFPERLARRVKQYVYTPRSKIRKPSE